MNDARNLRDMFLCFYISYCGNTSVLQYSSVLAISKSYILVNEYKYTRLCRHLNATLNSLVLLKTDIVIEEIRQNTVCELSISS